MTAPVIVENEVVPASAGSNSTGESVDWPARESANRPVEVTVAAGGDFGCPFELLRRQPVSEPVDVSAERAGPLAVVRLIAAGMKFSPCPVGKCRDGNFVFGRDRPWDVRSMLDPVARNSR